MERLYRFFLLFLFSFIVLHHFSSQAYAAQAWGPCANPTINGVTYTGVATIQCIVPLFRNVVVAILELAGVGLFITLIAAGFTFLTGGGNPKQLEQARNTITYAIIGIVIIVAAYLIIQVIGSFTGVQGLPTFQIPNPN